MKRTHAEPVLLIRLAGVEGADRRADQVAGDAQQHQGDGVDPVVGAHRHFPHIHPPVIGRMRAVRRSDLFCTDSSRTHRHHSKETWWRCLPCGSYRCTAQARHGSKEWMVRIISTGCSRFATGVPISDCLKRRALLLGIARRTVPGGRHHQLVVVDLAVLDLDPVRQRAARSFHQADAFGFRRPASSVPSFSPLKVETSRVFTRSISSL